MFQLPHKSINIGFDFRNDSSYNLPYYVGCIPNSYAYKLVPAQYCQNFFVLAINADCMITAEYVTKKLQYIQTQPNRMITLDIVKRGSANTQISLSMIWAIFDQIPSFQIQRPAIFKINVSASHSHVVRSPSKPAVPKSFMMH